MSKARTCFFIDFRNVSGPTLDLSNAAVEGDIAKMQSLIQLKKADVNGHIAPKGSTALHKAIWNKKSLAADFLIQNGASVHERDNGGWGPLHIAAQVNDPDMINYLLTLNPKPDVNDQNTAFKVSPLHIAAHEGNRDAVIALLKHNASIDILDEDGETPFSGIENAQFRDQLRDLLTPEANTNNSMI